MPRQYDRLAHAYILGALDALKRGDRRKSVALSPQAVRRVPARC